LSHKQTKKSSQKQAQRAQGGTQILCAFCAFLWLILFSVLSSRAEVIDRILAVVDGHIITLSDVRQERQTRATLGEKPVEDEASLAKDLADQYLIDQQIAEYPNIDVSSSEVESDIQKLNLKSAVVPDALRDAVRRRIRVQKFFDVKFRQSIRPSDEAIHKYYDEVFVPEARKRGMNSIPPLTDKDMADAIRENVIQESLDHEVEVWLEAIRRRSNVEVFQ